jgi:O-6-methylguanine DNA methyltransferase
MEKRQANTDYERIALAIEYIREHFKEQPGLETVANRVGLSPAHFQRMFTAWAGISPKKFQQYVTLEYAKKILRESKISLFDTAFEAGLSGTGRLHDLFVTIESMTPGEYKNGGESLKINYSFADSPFGELLTASTSKGICYMAFVQNQDRKEAVNLLLNRFPYADYFEHRDEQQKAALSVFNEDWSRPDKIKLHLKGTRFQLKVWETLLKIPAGQLTTYGDIAREAGIPQGSRAVGTAIGENPVAFIIPCHRVIRSSGEWGGYHWGENRKTAIIGWEASRISPS